MPFCGTFQKLRPLSLLTHLSSCYDSAHLQVFSNSVSWSVYLDQGKVIYALHSIEPFERLERHLHRLIAQKNSELDSETWMQLRLIFKTASESQSIQPPDYQTICWLVNHKYLNLVQATTLIEGLASEAIESLLSVESGTYTLKSQRDGIFPALCKLELQPLVENCQKRSPSQSLGLQKIAHDTSIQPQQLVQNIVSPISTTATDNTATSLDDVSDVSVDRETPKLSAKSRVFQAPHAPTLTQSGRESRRLLTYLLLTGISVALGLTALIGRFYSHTQGFAGGGSGKSRAQAQLSEIRTLKIEGRYKECIATAVKVVRKTPSKTAQGLLNECLMSYAEQLAAAGKFAEAISAAQKIPANSYMYPQAQKRLREWKEI